MATQNDFLPFATGPGANVVDQATYAALGALTTGFLSGTAQSGQLNKVWRQSSIMAAVIAQFIVAQTGQAAVDDGTTATLLANFTKAVNAASKQRVILPDSGSVNAYAAANPVPMTSLPTVSGIVQTISVKTTNTGASTYSPDGLAARPIFGLGGAALQGGEMVANGIATLVSYVGPLLNGGSLCWVLFECIGGASPVPNPTQSLHALNLGSAQSLFAPVAGSASQRFQVAAAQNVNDAVSLGQFAFIAAVNGYVKIPTSASPIILQWGQSACANSATTTTVFPLAFPTACLNVIAGGANASGNVQAYSVVNNQSRTQFQWNGFTAAGGATPTLGASGTVNAWWLAIGT
ncbi:hypothetical protein LGM48_24260 [Burkholderia multivorans]|nr:hypothetical protein [Burkholderia multivorans]